MKRDQYVLISVIFLLFKVRQKDFHLHKNVNFRAGQMVGCFVLLEI
jgi:hypothetical protein